MFHAVRELVDIVWPWAVYLSAMLGGLVTLVAVVGAAVIGLSKFSDAAKNLVDFVRDVTAPRISGSWISPTLLSPYGHTYHYHLSFDFEVHGQDVTGWVTEFIDNDPEDKRSFKYRILDGKFSRKAILFRTELEISNRDKSYSNLYEGRAQGTQLAFKKWNDVGSAVEVEVFLAQRCPAATT